MPGDNIENSLERYGWIRYLAADEATANEFVSGVEDLAAQAGVVAEYFVEPQRKTVVHKNLVTSGLFSWAQEYADSDEKTAVITRDNITAFKDGGGDTPRARANRASRFFNAVTRRSISSIDMDDGGYVTFAVPEGKDIAQSSIRVIRSLELLRKLKTDQLGVKKTDGTVGLKGLGEVGINFFERYCEALFPETDMSQATQELDVEHTEYLFNRSSRRRKIWGWVGQQSVGAVFLGKDAARGAGLQEDQSKIGLLTEMGLIARLPTYPNTRIDRDMKYQGVPYIKLHDDRWDAISELLAKT